MVTRTRARIYAPETQVCNATKKRKRVVSSNDVSSRKAAKTSKTRGRPIHYGNTPTTRARRAATRLSDKHAHPTDDHLDKLSLPPPRQSDSMSRNDSHFDTCALSSPAWRNDHRRSGDRLRGSIDGVQVGHQGDNHASAMRMARDGTSRRTRDETMNTENCAQRHPAGPEMSPAQSVEAGDIDAPSSAYKCSRISETTHSGLYSLTLGPSIPPPTNPCTPPEYVPAVTYDPDFFRRFMGMYAASQSGDGARVYKYGGAIATEYRRGFTPEEDRARWRLRRDLQQAEAEAWSDDEDMQQ